MFITLWRASIGRGGLKSMLRHVKGAPARGVGMPVGDLRQALFTRTSRKGLPERRFDLICNAQRRVSTRPSHAPASSRIPRRMHPPPAGAEEHWTGRVGDHLGGVAWRGTGSTTALVSFASPACMQRTVSHSRRTVSRHCTTVVMFSCQLGYRPARSQMGQTRKCTDEPTASMNQCRLPPRSLSTALLQYSAPAVLRSSSTPPPHKSHAPLFDPSADLRCCMYSD